MTIIPSFKACRIFVSTIDAGKSNTEYPDVTPINLDEYMVKEGCDGIFVHTEYQVLLATLSKTKCLLIHQRLQRLLSINAYPNSVVISGATQAAMKDASQIKQNVANPTLTCANYGCSVRPQGATAGAGTIQYTGSRKVGIKSVAKGVVSLDRFFHSFYEKMLYPVFFQPWKHIGTGDRLYGPSPKKSKRTKRIPRINRKARFDGREEFRLPYVLLMHQLQGSRR